MLYPDFQDLLENQKFVGWIIDLNIRELRIISDFSNIDFFSSDKTAT